MELAFTPEQIAQTDSIETQIFGPIRMKEQFQKLAGLFVSGIISIYLMYALRATFLVRFGVFGLVMPAGVVLFGFLAFKEICDLFSLLTIWSMIDASELKMNENNAQQSFSPEIEAKEESKTKKKVRFVGLPPAPPKRRRSTSLTESPVATSTVTICSTTDEPGDSTFFSKVLSFFHAPNQRQIDADDLLTSAWGSE